ncbi:RbsD/FucU family protein [Bifidobacterium sp. ESL0827]|uniref:RbsD/FucU family protein n=1 Tax=Bifidobacterium sp. ESL0827 TaxID=3448583 RepID=UPI0040411C64
MLRMTLLNPILISALSRCGHGDKVLIADGNYPLMTQSMPNADRVYLALRPNLPTVTEVLEVVLTAIPVEKVEVMEPSDSMAEPPIYDEFKPLLNYEELLRLSRTDFYRAVRNDPHVVVAVGTGDMRTFGNILLTVGVREH